VAEVSFGRTTGESEGKRQLVGARWQLTNLKRELPCCVRANVIRQRTQRADLFQDGLFLAAPNDSVLRRRN